MHGLSDVRGKLYTHSCTSRSPTYGNGNDSFFSTGILTFLCNYFVIVESPQSFLLTLRLRNDYVAAAQRPSEQTPLSQISFESQNEPIP
jgi:hypothetical protein